MFKIRKYSAVENTISIIIGLLCVLIGLWGYLWTTLAERDTRHYVLPEYELIQEEEPEVIVEERIDYDLEHLAIVEEVVIEEPEVVSTEALNSYDGVCYGPSGKETYYNLPMHKVVQIMRDRGYTEADYPYIEREDGVKCLGDYVIVAASLEKYRRGNIIQTSLGPGIVCDTGTFAETNPDQIDIAVNW